MVSHSVADPDPEGSETFGRIRIRSGNEINISDPVSDPDFGSGFESGFESGSEINQKKGALFSGWWFHTIIHISHVHVVVRYVYACADGLVEHWKNSYCIAKIYTSPTAEC